MKPLVIDLCCGLGGWTKGFLAEGYDAVGFDVERHRYPKREFTNERDVSKLMCGKDKHGNTLINRALEGVHGFHRAPLTGEWMEYPGQLVLQDIRTLHGSQLRDAAVIVASPPCQKYSYMAMPFGRSKALAKYYRDPEHPERLDELNELVNACIRIADEAGVPLIMENVKGAQPWIGRAKWHFGSYYLWGDLPALMPSSRVIKAGHPERSYRNGHVSTAHLTNRAEHALKNNSNGSWFAIGSPGQTQTGGNPVHAATKGFAKRFEDTPMARVGSKYTARKAASAMIAEIPFDLAQWIARCFKPSLEATA